MGEAPQSKKFKEASSGHTEGSSPSLNSIYLYLYLYLYLYQLHHLPDICTPWQGT